MYVDLVGSRCLIHWFVLFYVLKVKNKYGLTALMMAAKKGYSIVVQTLLDAGADFCATSEVNRYDIVSLLISCQANERAIDFANDPATREILQRLDDAKAEEERAAHVFATGTKLLSLIMDGDEAAVEVVLTSNMESHPDVIEFESDSVCDSAN